MQPPLPDFRPRAILGPVQVRGVHMQPPLPDFRPRAILEGEIMPNNYKTQLCDKWSTLDGCPYGEGCRFAHGEAEWQKHPQHKTIPCKFFHRGTGCHYGDRCHFIHDGAGHP
ncbi:zinc finger CCCH domain-containing protein 14-like [Prunus yedoensis var. nudiflora]|uniref:Zinc finger CCCH domain-containing protein 14-like n=1 Tax=Prunus yedoensis var. nudiflora TaxID=2094558 RepID=A0A314XYS4_PRUYE|nr:zinc finger CCCH domain-containing protein 14-like [Prunus yedoensis var. nudiflora]PQQ09611.1 zinc finger CCCH domain-containing protein 14-like [Prunus yedoensis var. nudiflora]